MSNTATCQTNVSYIFVIIYIGVSLAFYVNDIIDYIIGWHNPDRENLIRLNLGDCSKVYFTEI